MDRYRISQAAERAGMPATTLRYYDSRGLMPVRRSPSGYRTYDESDVDRLRFIGTAKDLGLSLDRIRDLVDVRDDGRCRDVRDTLGPLLRERIADTDRQVAALDASRAHLVAALGHLEALPARDTPCDPDCAFLGTARAPEPPIACTLSGSERADRMQRWRDALAGAPRDELADGGIRVHPPVEQMAEVAALVAAEARCCAFLTFRLTAAPGGVTLDAHAPSWARELLRELLG
ncbi:MerR family transcriptional regulator [Pseudonocardia endophytica]|uniref:DNA-binding transcriptional MerR regulator n=1 Tax=Pseudonocardia endophytica TaxID=401976 RepID=A0A4R1HMS7_PSEEN|nr:MerR family transcriptional regulator [Pseudonocardia endophytica]TCK22363.1 DNA-binding transcriptional MerR regulator [Pseudonocardia endophytica]